MMKKTFIVFFIKFTLLFFPSVQLALAKVCDFLSPLQQEKLAKLIKNRIFFHGTSERNLQSILKTGLQPRKSAPQGTFGATHKNVDTKDCENNVFLSKDAITGIKYAGIAIDQVLNYFSSHQQEMLEHPEYASPVLVGIFAHKDQSKVKFLKKKPKIIYKGFYQYKGGTEGIKSHLPISSEQLFIFPKEVSTLKTVDDLDSIDDLMAKSHISAKLVGLIIEKLGLPANIDKKKLLSCFFSLLLKTHAFEGAEGIEKIAPLVPSNQIFSYWKKKVLFNEEISARKIIESLKRTIQEKENGLFLKGETDDSQIDIKYEFLKRQLIKLSELSKHMNNSSKLTVKSFITKRLTEITEKCFDHYWIKIKQEGKSNVDIKSSPAIQSIRRNALEILSDTHLNNFNVLIPFECLPE